MSFSNIESRLVNCVRDGFKEQMSEWIDQDDNYYENITIKYTKPTDKHDEESNMNSVVDYFLPLSKTMNIRIDITLW